MNLVDLAIQHAQTITVVGGAGSVIILSWVRFKEWFMKKYRERQEYLKSRNQIPSTLNEIKTKIDNVDNRLMGVEREIKPNGGGSMKDALRMVKAEIEAIFWLNPRPSFRTTSNGINTLVNESYCHLCGVSSEGLLKLGWKNFAEDEEQLDDFMRRWLESSKECSQFSGKLKIKNYKDESVGEWIIKLRPLGEVETENEYLWHGTLHPYDYQAIEYAKNQNIPV